MCVGGDCWRLCLKTAQVLTQIQIHNDVIPIYTTLCDITAGEENRDEKRTQTVGVLKVSDMKTRTTISIQEDKPQRSSKEPHNISVRF